MATLPSISVVVATHNRRDRLEHLLRALTEQRDTPPFEAIVVDDGSTDGTIDLLQQRARELPFSLVPVRLEQNSGPATARNAGWRRAVAPIVAFTDDDCAPQPRWLSALAGAFAPRDVGVVQGRTIPDPDQPAGGNAFSHSVRVEDEWGFYETCNIGYRRALLESLGGFDEGFGHTRTNGAARRAGPTFGEDADLGWRAKRAGARVVFEPGALVLHDVRPQRFADHLRGLRRREGLVRAVKRNPEMRRVCHYRVFWRPGHAPALGAGVGLAIAVVGRRSPRTVLAGASLCLPYVRYRAGESSRPSDIPLTLASDLAEMVVMAAASVRYRTLVL